MNSRKNYKFEAVAQYFYLNGFSYTDALEEASKYFGNLDHTVVTREAPGWE